MSVFTHDTMTHHHDQRDHFGLLARIGDTLHVWRERQHARRELMRFTERDIHDAGLSSTDVMYEAAKPFWRA